jgi:hypothetical protein
MQLANIKVSRAEKSSSFPQAVQRKSSSLKNIKNVKLQIQKQEQIRKKLNRAAENGKDAKLALQLELELKKAFEKIRGIKVHDDLALLRKAEKRLTRKKKKSAELWANKKEELEQSRKERQEKRNENIDKYRGKRKSRPLEAEEPSKGAKPTRKQRRHENLMKFGPKKTRADREEKKKERRKQMKQQKSKSGSKLQPKKSYRKP